MQPGTDLQEAFVLCVQRLWFRLSLGDVRRKKIGSSFSSRGSEFLHRGWIRCTLATLGGIGLLFFFGDRDDPVNVIPRNLSGVLDHRNVVF